MPSNKMSHEKAARELILRLHRAGLDRYKLYHPFTAAGSVDESTKTAQELGALNATPWRFDFAWPEIRFAVDIIANDATMAHSLKNQTAHAIGWNIYLCKHSAIDDGQAVLLIGGIVKHLQSRSKAHE